MKYRRATLPALLLLTLAASPAHALFQVVGPDGRVTNTDRAPGPADGRMQPVSKETGRASDLQLPYALRQVAEASVAAGEREQALKLYRRAAEEGVQNANARPRTEDLVATCLSMARQGVQPDAELVRRLRATREGLGDPW